MNFKLKNDQLINGDIISPEIVCATFSDQLTTKAKKDIVLNLNHGHEMLMVYKRYRGNLHIENVAEMLRNLENVFMDYDWEMYIAAKEIPK